MVPLSEVARQRALLDNGTALVESPRYPSKAGTGLMGGVNLSQQLGGQLARGADLAGPLV